MSVVLVTSQLCCCFFFFLKSKAYFRSDSILAAAKFMQKETAFKVFYSAQILLFKHSSGKSRENSCVFFIKYNRSQTKMFIRQLLSERPNNTFWRGIVFIILQQIILFKISTILYIHLLFLVNILHFII